MNTTGSWLAYDAERLARIGAPDSSVSALTGRGLPGSAHDLFVRVPARELQVADLPECGRAAFLAQAGDGYWNTYWLSLRDGSIVMRYGKQDEPVDHVKRINTSVTALQAVLEAWCDYKDSGLTPADGEAYEHLVINTITRAVSADPEAFHDEQAWWPTTFEEVEYTLPGILSGDRALYQLVRQDETGSWVLDHPGYEDEDD